MAAVSKECVRISSTDGDVIMGRMSVKAIKAVAGGSGFAVSLKSEGITGGVVMWESGTLGNNVSMCDQLDGVQMGDLYVHIASGSGTVYIYCG